MLTAMGDVMRRCYEKGWLTSRDGNISLRQSLDGVVSKLMYISPMGVRKNKIEPEHIIKVNIHKDVVSTVGKNVSIEFDMHFNLLVDAKSTRAVLHCHPTNVVAAMYAGWDLQAIAKEFPELKRYTKVGPTVKFHEAGSLSLAEETSKNLRDGTETGPIGYDIVGQERHGVCAIAKSPWDAYEHVERLDHICEIILKTGLKPPKKELRDDEVTSKFIGIPNCS